MKGLDKCGEQLSRLSLLETLREGEGQKIRLEGAQLPLLRSIDFILRGATEGF